MKVMGGQDDGAATEAQTIIVFLCILFTGSLGLSLLFWATADPTTFIIFSFLSLVLQVGIDSLREGEEHWPVADKFQPYATMRMYGHIAIVLVAGLTAGFLLASDWQSEWSSGTIPVAWHWVLYILIAVTAFTTLPAILALTNARLWQDDRYTSNKRYISIVVIREIITVGFAVPLVYGLSDIVNDNDDTEWRHLAASLVFTRAVVHFIVFWYVNKWEAASPLEDSRTLSEICKGVGMLVIYTVIIRRLHENKLLTTMQFVSPKDNIALVGALLSLLVANLIHFAPKSETKKEGVLNSLLSASGAVALLFFVVVIMFISIAV